MSLGYGVVQLDVTIVNTALNSIGISLGGGVAELQWVVSAYTIAFAAFILTAGALGDRIGAKRVFMAGFAIFTAASVACALAPNAATLIAARAVQGLARSHTGAEFAGAAQPRLSGREGARPRGRYLGRRREPRLTAGPFVGGGLIALVGWRSIFLVNLPIGLAGLWLTWRYASETTRSPQREIDLPGQVAAIAALGWLAGAIIEGGALGWGNAFVIAGFVASAVLAVLFVLAGTARERSRCCRCRCSGIGCSRLTSLVGLLVNVAFYGLIFVLQPVLPAGQRPVAVRNRSGVRADDGRGAAGQPAGAARGRTDRRACDHRRGHRAVGDRMPGAARHRAGTSYWAIVRAVDRRSAPASASWCRR